MTKTNAATRTDATAILDSLRYTPAPTLDALLLGAAVLSIGHRGDSVQSVQAALNAVLGIALALDGMFGPQTQGAVRDFRTQNGLPGGFPSVDLLAWVMLRGAMDNAGLRDNFHRRGSARSRSGPVRAPRYAERAPNGSVPAGQLKRADEQRRISRRPIVSTAPVRGQTPADAELASLQSRTVASAVREVGTRETGRSNRGPRVDDYARRARMPLGGAWCGYFTGFNYSEAAREAGGEFRGLNGFHSMQKARSFFEYRSFTNNSRSKNAELDTLRDTHVAEGSARRFMTLGGSAGQRHAESHNRPHEVYEPGTLPVRAGDTALFSRGHVGLVESYDQSSGRLTTVEGNTARGVMRREYNLNDPEVRAGFEGFGRPARGDFDVASTTPRSEVEVATPEVSTPVIGAPTLALPPRQGGAETGSAFLERTAGMSRADREREILSQIEAGNVPASQRELVPVEVASGGHTATMFVAPDYLAIGSDEDFVRIPMNPVTAQAIADRTGTSLPTAKIVDDIYQNAQTRLTPQPIPPSGQMMSNAYTARHHQMVEGQRAQNGGGLGSLTAGHKKDVVITNRLAQHPDRVAIYGWHRPSGRPIQPLSTLHVQNYADYSHGARLVDQNVIVDGHTMRLSDALRDPELAPLFSREGPIAEPRAD